MSNASVREPAPYVLVVDDDEDICEVIAVVLEGAGYRVVTARSGTDALAHLAGAPAPGLMLLDLMMPGMDGCQVRERLLEDPRLAGIPVVFFTGARGESVLGNLGGVPVIPKPIELARLLEVIESYLPRC